MSTSADTDLSFDVPRSLLRGAISPQEAHEKALALAVDTTANEVAELRRISAEHTRTAELLRTEVFRLGGTPAGSAGAWGAFPMPFRSSADFLGVSPAFSSLCEGEGHNLREDQESLEAPTGPTKMLVAEKLSPKQR